MRSRQFAFVCEPGWEAVLSNELTLVFPECGSAARGDGWIDLDSKITDSLEPTVAFASQCLPAAEPIAGPSIAEWVRLLGPRLIDLLATHDGPWRLHVFAVSGPSAPVGPGRAALIEKELVDWLRKKQRRLLRSRNEQTGRFFDDEALAQIGLRTPKHGWLSVSLPGQLRRLRRCVSPFPGGIVRIGPDQKAPSRAFAKLLEAEIRLGRQIESGQTCVDLGSSPGSWAYIALRRGASVTAVDRTPLRGDLMANPRLQFVRGDAFQFEPTSPVDWLLCDVVAAPERSLDLLKRWLQNRWCRQFCVTVKFRGKDEYDKLEDAKGWLLESGAEFLLRRLTSNKNEVTVVGTCEGVKV